MEERDHQLIERIEALQTDMRKLAGRVEEIAAYFAARATRVADSQSVYLGDHTALTFLASGHRIYVDTRSVDIGSHLLTYGLWEDNYARAFRRLIRPGDVVFDVGANHGFYTLVAAAITGPTGRVHAFEANSRLAQLTNMSAHINGFGSFVTVHQLAVGETAGQADLSFNDQWSGGGSLFASGQEHSEACRVVALDELFPDPAFRVDVMKLDIEGGEGRALKGMRRLLERSTDVRMMVEFAPVMLRNSGVPPAELVEFLSQLGFRFWHIDAEGGLHEGDWGKLATLTDGLENLVLSRTELSAS